MGKEELEVEEKRKGIKRWFRRVGLWKKWGNVLWLFGVIKGLFEISDVEFKVNIVVSFFLVVIRCVGIVYSR